MSPVNHQWKKIEITQHAFEFWKLAGLAIDKNAAVECPDCREECLRYYAHHFSNDSSAIWIWCINCKLWTVASNMKLEMHFNDPFANTSPQKLQELELSNWIGRLDSLWNSGVLPQTFSRA